jgi:hypothetical protein
MNSTVENGALEQNLENPYKFNKFTLRPFLDPLMFKIETKKLLTDWLNLKGGEGFSGYGT